MSNIPTIWKLWSHLTETDTVACMCRGKQDCLLRCAAGCYAAGCYTIFLQDHLPFWHVRWSLLHSLSPWWPQPASSLMVITWHTITDTLPLPQCPEDFLFGFFVARGREEQVLTARFQVHARATQLTQHSSLKLNLPLSSLLLPPFSPLRREDLAPVFAQGPC